jgi:hypothetical protein
VRHPVSGEYLCWIKVMSAAGQRSTVLVADDILGPYRIVKEGFETAGHQRR